MAIVFRACAEDLLRCRFAISPLGETADALRSLARPAVPGHLSWQRQARQLLPELAIGPLLAVLSVPGYQPDFLCPAPAGPFTQFGAELDQVRGADPERVAAELARWRAGHPGARDVIAAHPGLSGDPAQVRDLLAGQLERAWQGLVEPWWPRLRDILDADLTVRARQLAEAGVAATLNDLHPRIRFRGGVLEFAMPARQELDLDRAGPELVLIPSVFAWPGPGISFDPPAVIYPARGIAALWQPPPHAASDLARLIGTTRAMLLHALAEPASTTGLAARCGLAVSTVSEHLAVLRANGLVTTTRTGRLLRHQRTPLGVALAPGARPGPAPGPAAGQAPGPAPVRSPKLAAG